MKIAITGGTGFVGQAVLDIAAECNIPVRALARRAQDDRSGISWIRGDLANHAALADLVQGVDALIHIAGVVNAPDATAFHAGNAAGTAAVVDAARSVDVQRLIHVSSLAAREPALSQYGGSKRQAEEIVKASGLDWTIVRPPAVYGPRDTEIFELFKAALWRIVPMPPAGRTGVVHVADLARLLIALIPSGPLVSQRLFEPDDGRVGGWGHVELARAIGDAVGRKVWVPHVPRGALMTAARLDRMFRGEQAKLTTDRARYMVHPDWVGSREHAVPRELWHAQIDTGKGLAETARWYRAHGWL